MILLHHLYYGLCVTFRRMRTVSKQCSRQSWHKRQECLILAIKGPVRTCNINVRLYTYVQFPVNYTTTMACSVSSFSVNTYTLPYRYPAIYISTIPSKLYYDYGM